jgi:DNA helicase-2/ATP-dependent DNA helicase PcrA
MDNAYNFALEIIQKSGILADLKSDNSAENISKLENIEELLNGIKEYTKNPDNKETGIMKGENLQNVSLITDADKENTTDRNRVSLMTIHSAKGLEFGYVYIVGMEEGLFPGNNSIQSEQSLEEERRLFYVALTRAAVKAFVSFAQTRYRWGNLTSAIPSRFLRDIDKAYLAIINVKETSEIGIEKPQINFFQKKTEVPKRQLKSLEPKAPSPESIDTSEMRPGMEVEHARFGLGRILELDIEGNDVRAKIDFYNAGIKTLLLKFAKLDIIQ